MSFSLHTLNLTSTLICGILVIPTERKGIPTMTIYTITDLRTDAIISIDRTLDDAIDSFLDFLWDCPAFTRTLPAHILNLNDDAYRLYVAEYADDCGYQVPGLYVLREEEADDYEYDWQDGTYHIW